MLSLLDLAGWMGGGFTVVAYGLVSSRRCAPDSKGFQVTNMLGAGLLAMASFSHGAFSSAAINVVWIALGGQVLLRAARHRPVRPSDWDISELSTSTVTADVDTCESGAHAY